jgi:hypothetical protein
MILEWLGGELDTKRLHHTVDRFTGDERPADATQVNSGKTARPIASMGDGPCQRHDVGGIQELEEHCMQCPGGGPIWLHSCPKAAS